MEPEISPHLILCSWKTWPTNKWIWPRTRAHCFRENNILPCAVFDGWDWLFSSLNVLRLQQGNGFLPLPHDKMEASSAKRPMPKCIFSFLWTNDWMPFSREPLVDQLERKAKWSSVRTHKSDTAVGHMWKRHLTSCIPRKWSNSSVGGAIRV